ncbi:MAG: RusA family crossover junction endodeoxyribonuclease [Candidatus Omnitrophica bacterium]|nr:RusA family crossover junction endodeoxyribonuclease [Candidatus Omnitrophota bacterium]
MRSIKFTVVGKQQPAGSKRVVTNRHTGKAYVIDANDKARDWKTKVAQYASDAMGGAGVMTGPIILIVVFAIMRPKSHYTTKGEIRESAPKYPTQKPDVTKLLRAVEDALTGVVWRDDAQVCYQMASKSYGTHGSHTVISVDEEMLDDEIINEIGNMLWYCSQLLQAHSITMSDCMHHNISKLESVLHSQALSRIRETLNEQDQADPGISKQSTAGGTK